MTAPRLRSYFWWHPLHSGDNRTGVPTCVIGPNVIQYSLYYHCIDVIFLHFYFMFIRSPLCSGNFSVASINKCSSRWMHWRRSWTCTFTCVRSSRLFRQAFFKLQQISSDIIIQVDSKDIQVVIDSFLNFVWNIYTFK